ncbi:GTPase HflX [Desulfatitalea alkaliphila]|uniref:GTPase HflX n=1 Tax=Desulfatitalea alkaliphila TaxID=2929485 RepID=A0AA41UPR3_9BACT|nr:GTPase HflX [Desulfatitalea alkaliphila]MCJ8500713.1 GTPase HflX [Desulfatitalea alkaliphila]
MKKVWGNTKGLKAAPLRRLENLYRRRIPPALLVTPDMAREMAALSYDIQRQIAVLIDRAGRIAYVLVGDAQQIFIPELAEYRAFPGRLRGVRCVHTHIKDEPLDPDDLTDLALLRLDLMATIAIGAAGQPLSVHWAHILPGAEPPQMPYQVRERLQPHDLDIGCQDLVLALEREMGQLQARSAAAAGSERALLVSVTTAPRKIALDSLAELTELCRSADIEVQDTVLQLRKQIDPRTLMGSGKLKELAIRALQSGVSLIIFDQNLNPSQIKTITDQIELKVIDRTQLILDIFAQRASSKEGKLQVELAQLKYLLPRLVTKNTAMSRLTGGIGGRGPGETKLEINRRRVRDRINNLEKALLNVQKHRRQQRRRREQKGVPVISIIGYTNAGKSTLLNTLTQSRVLAESRLFATLDPSSRRLRFPRDMEVIITDTVGFIRDLPKDLVVAFRATLEALEGADLLLHVIDLANPRHGEQIRAVEKILEELSLNRIAQVRALNKMDLLPADSVAQLAQKLDGVPICARDQASLTPLIERMAHIIEALPQDPIVP